MGLVEGVLVKSVVKVASMPPLARRMYLKVMAWMAFCVAGIGVIIFGHQLNPRSHMNWPGFFWATAAVGVVTVVFMGYKWLLVGGVLATLCARRAPIGWRLGSPGGFLTRNTIEVVPGEELSLTSRAESDRVRRDGRQVGYRWTIKQGDRKMSFVIEAPVTAAERGQLDRWWAQQGQGPMEMGSP